MTNSISPFQTIYTAPQSQSQKVNTETNPISEATSGKFELLDKVTISAEALNKYTDSKSNADKTEYTSSWSTFSGLKSGTTELKNGHKQVVTIEGSSMELLEYDGDKLIRSVKGELTEKGTVLDTEIYDEFGKTTQKINTVFETIKDKNAAEGWTAAKVTRNIQWLENETVTRSMSDSMQLRSQYKDSQQKPFGSTVLSKTEALSEDESPDVTHRTSHLDESYEDGKLVRQTSVESLEIINEIENGPDQITTRTSASQGIGANTQHISKLYEGKLAKHDSEANSASESMGKEVDMILGDTHTLLSSFDDKNSGPKNDEYRIKFNPF